MRQRCKAPSFSSALQAGCFVISAGCGTGHFSSCPHS
jgi:hypothetical protein